MVDINLIGDDKTGEERTGDEERVDDFTQTSSMDTQELAFEERTETFDTTKTAGFAHRRSYSSIMSTVIILGVIGVLGFGIWYFMFRDSGANQANLPEFVPDSQEEADLTEPEVEPEVSAPPPSSEVTLPAEQQQQPPPQTEVVRNPEPEPKKAPDKPVTSTPTTTPATRPPARTTPAVAEDFTAASSQFVMSSKSAIQTVNSIINAMPTSLNTTLLSYAGGRLRLEYVAKSESDARSFSDQLGQTYGSGNLTVISEKQVASNGQSMDKILISGTVASKSGGQTPGVDILDVAQVKEWMQSSAKQFGIQVRQFDSQQGRFIQGYQKTPILVRIYGTKESLQRFMDFLAAENLNLELTKILLVSPDMVTFTDDNLMLVMNLFLFQPS